MDFYDKKAREWGIPREEAKARFLNEAYRIGFQNALRPEDVTDYLKQLVQDTVREVVDEEHDVARYEQTVLKNTTVQEGENGRWELLTLEDCKFLFAVGIEIDS
jgi:hypothetical protein